MLTWRLSTGQAYAIVCCNSQSEHNPHLVVTCSTAASFLKIGCIASQTRINEPDCCAGQRTAEKLHGRRDNLRHFRRISNVIHCHLRHSDYVLMCFHWCGSFHLYVGYIDFPCWPFSWPRVILEFFFRSMRLIRCRDSLLRKSAYLCLFSNSLVLQGPVLSSRCLVWEAYSLHHYHSVAFPFLI